MTAPVTIELAVNGSTLPTGHPGGEDHRREAAAVVDVQVDEQYRVEPGRVHPTGPRRSNVPPPASTSSLARPSSRTSYPDDARWALTNGPRLPSTVTPMPTARSYPLVAGVNPERGGRRSRPWHAG